MEIRVSVVSKEFTYSYQLIERIFSEMNQCFVDGDVLAEESGFYDPGDAEQAGELAADILYLRNEGILS